ncbi:mucin-3A-like isoform X2 [Dendronephthya gigantea]|uniref:mucin-3A-like isoform X2 n=1 Tax=Dendronephthya gigantea TaxID=151771 RepID=UPI00106B9A87|nr:mucin-3A-like isoform X2 [Dendronephthya gigantea]
MNIGGIIAGFLVLLSLAWHITCKDTYDIPVAINALIQDPDKVDETEKFFYDQDKDFYSKVTPFDVAKNAEQSVEQTISKKIKVLFLTFASSHISNPLSLKDLKYTTKSNWSYTISVKSILNASNGQLVDISGQTVISKIQENAMKVLGKRYQFNSDDIRNKLGLGKMAYFAADEKIWIKVVGIIVENVIAVRNEALNLTTCYLAEMIGKTASQIQKFTLNEVDMYLYNTTKLLEKLPEYNENVIIRLYQTFNITPTFLARISNTELSNINAMMMKDVLNLFTNSVLKTLRVNANEISEKDSSFDPKMLLSCTDKWEPFKTIIISESFQNSAEAMSVEIDILSALINISYSDIQEFTITVMMDTLETVIDPLSQQKELVEATNLSAILQDQGLNKINTLNESVFNVIYSRTNFTEHQLGILYEWTSNDYLFSSIFTLEEANDVCKINTLNYVLLALARLTVGQKGDIPCKSFEVLREIWERKSLNYLESNHSTQEQLSLHSSISMLVNQLTDASFAINYRVLNVSSETEKLISQLSINNITAVTTYSSSYLKTKSFQDIIEIIVHLKRNGSFDREVVSHYILTSLITTSLLFTPSRVLTTEDNYPTSTNISTRTSNAIETTILPRQTGTTTLATANLSTSFISTAKRKMQPTSNYNISNTHNSRFLKSTLDQGNFFNNSEDTTSLTYSKIFTTSHVTNTVMSHPISPSVRFASNATIKTFQTSISILKESVSFSKPLSPNYSSDTTDSQTSVAQNSSKHRPTEYMSTTPIAMNLSSKHLPINISKTVTENSGNKNGTSSTDTVGFMTKQTNKVISSKYIATRLYSVTTSKLSTKINATVYPTSNYVAGSKMYTNTSLLHTLVHKTVTEDSGNKNRTSSTETVGFMTKQTNKVISSKYIATNVTRLYSVTTSKLSMTINATVYPTSNYVTGSKMYTNTSLLHTLLHTKEHSLSKLSNKSIQSNISVRPTIGNESLNSTRSSTRSTQSLIAEKTTSFNTDYVQMLSTHNLLTGTILSSKTVSPITTFTSKQNKTTTKREEATIATSRNTIIYTMSDKVMETIQSSLRPKINFTTNTSDAMYTTETKVEVRTTLSSSVMTGIDASSKDFLSETNYSSANMISLVIQTRGRESTTLSSVQSSTLLATPMLPTSTLVIADKMSLTKYPSTTSMLPTSTAVNQVAYSSNIPSSMSHSPAPIEPRIQNSSLYLSTSVLPASPTGISTALISSISLVKPTTTKTETITSSIQKPGSKCQPECKTGEWCILDNQNTVSMTCKDAKNLEGRLRITSGANFTVQLTDETSEAFKKFSIQIEILIDSICKRSQYESTFLGSQVLRFESGSIIVHYKLSFDSKLDLSSSTVEDIEQVFRNAQDTNFTIDNSSIAVEDYDECSTGKATKCDETATCNNTLGSYICICPKGSTGDGTSCRVANTRKPNDKEDVPWIIYVVIAIMVVLIIFLIVVIIYCEKKHKKKQRPQVLDFHNGGINMYPRSTSYLAQTPESEADLADGLGIVNRHGPQLNMVTFNPTPEDKKELELQKGQPGVFHYRL